MNILKMKVILLLSLVIGLWSLVFTGGLRRVYASW